MQNIAIKPQTIQINLIYRTLPITTTKCKNLFL